MAWQIWRVSTAKGKEFPGWKDGPIGPVYDDEEEASLARYLEWADDPVPDKADYYRLELREVNPPQEAA
jgi:hypothetical protein